MSRAWPGAMALLMMCGASASEPTESMRITRVGDSPANAGPPAFFTGQAEVQQVLAARGPSRLSAGYVTFQPGARSAWHTHPAGQLLVIVAGTGWVQEAGRPRQTVHAGDMVWTPPGVRHWHGATATTSMTQLSIQETVDGKNVNWEDKVTDAQFGSGQQLAAVADVTAPSMDELASVSPALAAYTESTVLGDLWHRPGLSPRDRSVVTVAALIARNQLNEMPFHFRRALDNGVTPAELSEIITHLAFYAGWPNATAAAGIARTVFTERGVTAAQLTPAHPELLPIDEPSEQVRAKFVQELAGDIAPGVVHYTGAVVFHDLWLRPGLTPRDRSLVTVSALIANGQTGQLAAHLDRGMNNGLTQPQIGEVLTQIEFYAGWPNVFSVLPIVKSVEEKRRQGAAHD